MSTVTKVLFLMIYYIEMLLLTIHCPNFEKPKMERIYAERIALLLKEYYEKNERKTLLRDYGCVKI